jgi:hypothetical protein
MRRACVAANRAGSCAEIAMNVVSRGRYLIQGSLEVPEGAMLQGVFRAPSAQSRNSGSLLLAVARAGGAKGVIRTKCI